MSDRRLRPLADVLCQQPALGRAIGDRLLHHVINDERVMATLSPSVLDHLTQLASVNASRDYRPHVVGVRSGTLG
ncbi:MAG: hypothetical protein D6690_13565 [Nitrospirae bacterium]|nr:MAG: hypothetical protein D6690_13565 [Nitrospirota bacterium]